MTEKVLRRQALASAPASAPGRPPAASSKFCLHFILSERRWSSSASIYIKTAAFATSQAGNFLFIVWRIQQASKYMTPLLWIKIAYNSSWNWKDILQNLLPISHAEHRLSQPRTEKFFLVLLVCDLFTKCCSSLSPSSSCRWLLITLRPRHCDSRKVIVEGIICGVPSRCWSLNRVNMQRPGSWSLAERERGTVNKH